MKHYVLLHIKSGSAANVVGVLHSASDLIARARAMAYDACDNHEHYEERMPGGGEIFRATYGVSGECFQVQAVEQMDAMDPAAPPPPRRSPEKLREGFVGALAEQLDGDWELVDFTRETEVVTRQLPDSPFLGKFPGANAFYSLHLRLNETARALLRVSDVDRAAVMAELEDAQE